MKGNNGTSLLSGVQAEAYPSTFNQTQFCIDNWEGFLGSLEPRLFDSSLVGDIVLSIYLADNAVLTTSKDCGLDSRCSKFIEFPDCGCTHRYIRGSGHGSELHLEQYTRHHHMLRNFSSVIKVSIQNYPF
jgi:hypothetical protein